ncbi:hypothetical protein G6321_00028775 [Bradyrhizobium barranii subsp. barranii]|uniref:Uncharacterized protein n=1 Tax=Bradyrhizobium barranii subsp. barranii TaxID=2823807 RepID=A0A7Z0QGW3_9BRAD|nr:hypothetical protein [Bradyrhizobium barranii]UGX98890.1 hypothetical protein G6321_00028775 [Bradyrhizobium barranii subsp. barranii]
MGNRTAKFISALVGSIIAGAPLAAVSQNAPEATSSANAASDCLASPKGVAPQGQHWYYRLERGTKRQCWYLRAEGGKDSAKAVQTAQAAPDAPTADSAAPQQQHPVQDARAEYLTPQGNTAPTTPNAPAPAKPAPMQQAATPSADSNAQQPPVATRWPDASAAAPSPAPQAAPAPVASPAPPSAKPSKSPAPVTLAAADATTDKATGSLQTLLLVIGGALALAGLLASIIYRFAGGRRVRVQDRRVNWDNREPHDDGRAPWLEAMPTAAPRAQQPRPVDFDAARPQAAGRPRAAQREATQREAAQLKAIDHAIDAVDQRAPQASNEVAELDEANMFNGEFEIEASAPRLAANDINGKESANRDDDVQIEDAVDVDVITAMLERLAQEGPRLANPNLEAGLANLVRNQRGQSAARA